MKNLRLLASCLLFVSFFATCTKDEDPIPTAGDPRNNFIGKWICNEDSQIFGTVAYSVDIYAHGSVTNRIIASNFYNLGFQASNCQIEINGNTLNIFQQYLSGYEIIGSGTLVNSSTINFAYTADDGSGLDNVIAVYTKTN